MLFGLQGMHEAKKLNIKADRILSDVQFLESKLDSMAAPVEVAEDKPAYEIEREERMDQFDKRIQDMKEQLALQQEQKHIATQAEEFHPLVKNLPHDTVNTSHRNPGPEYAV